MATWYVDTTASGANDGTSKTDAWEHIASALEYASYGTGGETIWVRRGQTHDFSGVSANVTIGDSSTFAAPIHILADDGSQWAGEGGLAKPILDMDTAEYYFYWNNTPGWVVQDLHFLADNTSRQIYIRSAATKFVDCVFQQVGTGETDGSTIGNLSVLYSDAWMDGCDFDLGGTVAYNIVTGSAQIFAVGCSFDGGAYTCLISNGYNFTNCTFGTETAHDVADFYHAHAGPIDGAFRGCTFGSATEFSIYRNYNEHPVQRIVSHDHDGTRGYTYVFDKYGVIDTFAASSTPDGQRLNGGEIVWRSILSSTEAWGPDVGNPVVEMAAYLEAGTYTIDVWTQPDGWSPVPDTEGGDANVWVEVLGWDTATSTYLIFDSRDEGSQDAQVDEEWHKIRVTNVAVDADGFVKIIVYQSTGDGSSPLYVDTVPTIGGSEYSGSTVLDGHLTVAPSPTDYPGESDVRSGVDYDSGDLTGTLDLPAVGDVQEGVEYGAAAEFTGTFGVPAEAEVELGVGYGEDDTEFTGSLTGSEPAAPSITAANDGTGTSATVTVDGDAGVTNTLYYRLAGTTDSWTAGANRSGDGTIAQTGLTDHTMYDVTVISASGGYNSVMSNVVQLYVTSGAPARSFNIIQVIDVEERGGELELLCEEDVSS